jgi:hypothetical protein
MYPDVHFLTGGRRTVSHTPIRPLPSVVTALLLAACFLIGHGAARADSAGDQLAQRVYDRPNGKDSTAVTTMTLTEKGHSPRVRQLITYRLENKPGEVAALIRFTEPGDIAGTGLLTQDHAAGDSDQWIYLPAMERVRRISASRKGGRFVGSDYYYEDMRDRKVSQDQHRIIGREVINGVSCEILESIPTEADNSVYAKRVSWIDPVKSVAMRIDFFEKGTEQPTKRWLLKKLEKVQGYWTVLDSVVTDLETGHQTRLALEKILYDRRLPQQLFSSRALEDESLEEEYRP